MKASLATLTALLLVAVCSEVLAAPLGEIPGIGPPHGQDGHQGTRSPVEASGSPLDRLVDAALAPKTAGQYIGSDTTPCCFSYAKNQIPRTHVREYFYTSSRCSQPATVFITRKNRQICSDPEMQWVKDYVNYLEMN